MPNAALASGRRRAQVRRPGLPPRPRPISPAVRGTLVTIAIATLVDGVLGFLQGATGAQFPPTAWILLVVLGVTFGGVAGRLSGNRAEARLSDADRTTALSLTPPPGRALLVVVHARRVRGSAVGIDIAVDGRPAAQRRSPRAVVLPVGPGRHEVAAVVPTRGAGEVAFVQLRYATGMGRNTAAVTQAANPAQLREALASMPLLIPEPGWGAAAA